LPTYSFFTNDSFPELNGYEAAEEARATPYAVQKNAGYSGAKLALQLSGCIIR
jgi:hypothetical protein